MEKCHCPHRVGWVRVGLSSWKKPFSTFQMVVALSQCPKLFMESRHLGNSSFKMELLYHPSQIWSRWGLESNCQAKLPPWSFWSSLGEFNCRCCWKWKLNSLLDGQMDRWWTTLSNLPGFVQTRKVQRLLCKWKVYRWRAFLSMGMVMGKASILPNRTTPTPRYAFPDFKD